MEQYRKNFSTFNSNSPFARHLESKVVTVKRLLYFNLSILFNLSRYLEMEVAGLQHLPVRGISKKDLSKSIYNSYNNCISKNSSLTWWVFGGFVFVWVVGWRNDKIFNITIRILYFKNILVKWTIYIPNKKNISSSSAKTESSLAKKLIDLQNNAIRPWKDILP